MGEIEAGFAQLRLQAVATELVGDLGAHLLAGRELHLELELRDAYALIDVGAKEHLDPLVLAVPARDVGEPHRIEVTAELAVDHVQHVAVELRSDAPRVVIGSLEPRGVLDEVRPEQERLAGPEQPVQVCKECRALLAGEVADRGAEECEQPPPSFWQPDEVVLEVAYDAMHLDARVLLGDPRRGLPQRLLRDVEGNEALQVSSLDHRIEQEPRLLGRS